MMVELPLVVHRIRIPHIPVEVLYTVFSNAIVDSTHVMDQLFLYFCCTVDFKVCQEVVSHRNQSVPWPALEPIHGAAGDEPGELQGAAAELLANLNVKIIYQHGLTDICVFAEIILS